MPTDMRGLSQYIADLRACRVRELEEKRVNKEMAHIRQKFKEGSLDGYQRKKYLSKIVFTYILGYPVDTGHMEAVNLISSAKYTEKQIGYLALTLLMHENSDIVRLVVNSIRKDLDDHNEINNCLALHAIANIAGKEMAEALVLDVHRLLISPTSQIFVKKKAALTLLRLYRKYPECFDAPEWALRIVSILDDRDLGVVTAVASLVMTVAQDNLDAFSVCYQKAVSRLDKIVIKQDYTTDYVYYRVPVPWLQIKLLRLLQYYPPSEDPTIRMMLHNVLQTIVDRSRDKPSNVQHSNAQNAVLFEAINLAIHLDTESSIVDAAATMLGRFIMSKETNVRYLGLDTMAHLAARSDSLDALRQHQDTVILSLRDKDISVRRRALDLLYSMCDGSNSREIVHELLRYMNVAEYTLREEMVLKIAILTEKFATEYEWYVDTILRLLSQAGDHVGDEVWYRVVQIVTNTEQLQTYAARRVFEYVRPQTVHENLVKVAAYLLGEYGHLVANEPGFEPINQFEALHSKSNLCSPATRALLLTTYFKWLNLFPEIRDQIISVLRRQTHVLDAELQQRACEYLAVAAAANGNEEEEEADLLSIVCDEMPPFPERESALLARLLKRHGDAGDRRVWNAGGRDVNKDKDDERYKGFGRRKAVKAADAIEAKDVADGLATDAPSEVANPDDIMGSLAGLDMSSPNGAAAQPGTSPTLPLLNGGGAHSPTLALAPSLPATRSASNGPSALPVPSVAAAPAPLMTHGADRWFDRLAYNSEGILWEDAQIQIGLKSEYHGHLGRMALYFGNKISVPYTAFTVTIESASEADGEALGVTMPKIATSTLQPLTQVQQAVQLECRSLFDKPPIMRVSYLAGSLQTLTLRLPVHISRFLEPVATLSATDFFERWRQIGGPPREAQRVVPIKVDASGNVDAARQRKIVGGARIGLQDDIDPNPSNLVGASVLHMSSAGKVGCLVRVEPNAAAKLCRVTVRTTNEDVSGRILDLLCKPLSTK